RRRSAWPRISPVRWCWPRFTCMVRSGCSRTAMCSSTCAGLSLTECGSAPPARCAPRRFRYCWRRACAGDVPRWLVSEADEPAGNQLTATEPDGRTAAIEGLRLTLPLAVAVFGFGVSFGAVARAAHLGWLAPLIMSATSFAGSAQFAAASILGTGGGIAAAVTAAVMLNSRYLAIGISVASAIRGNP